MNWLAQGPLIFFTLLGLGLAACLDLFVTLKREIQADRQKHGALRATITQLNGQIAELEQKLVESQELVAVAAPEAPGRGPGINVNSRAQALRMFRRGESAPHISAALGIPEKEVELLLKLQQLAADPTPPPQRARRTASVG